MTKGPGHCVAIDGVRHTWYKAIKMEGWTLLKEPLDSAVRPETRVLSSFFLHHPYHYGYDHHPTAIIPLLILAPIPIPFTTTTLTTTMQLSVPNTYV